MAIPSNNFGFVPDNQPTNNNFGFVPDAMAAPVPSTNTTAPSMYSSVMGSAPVQLALGAENTLKNTTGDILSLMGRGGQAIHNAPYNLANLVSPALASYMPSFLTPTNINFNQLLGNSAPIGQGSTNNMAYDIGGGAGNAALFMAGGAPLDAARAAAESVPIAGKVAQYLGGDGVAGVARRAIGSGAYGAVTNPTNPLPGAEEGAALSGAGDLLPGVFGAIPALSSVIRPQKYANSILQDMGGGNSLENNAKSLAQDIKNSYNKRIGESNDLYNPVFSTLGNSSIYDGGIDGAYPALSPKITDSFDDKISDLHDDFTQNPTLNNAHALQSQLGTSIRKLQNSDARGNLSVADRNVMYRYQNAQGALKNDTNNFLNTTDPTLAQQYSDANQHYLDNVVPYIENSKIAQIAKGRNTNPSNIASIFKNPSDNTQAVVNDMGEGANNKILYSVLGKPQNSMTAQNLQKSSNQLDSMGLGSYITPKLSQQFDTLSGRIRNRNIAQMGTGALVGGSLANSLSGALPFAELAGAGISGATSPYVMNAIQKYIPISQAGKGMQSLSSSIYPYLKNALIANLAKGSQ